MISGSQWLNAVRRTLRLAKGAASRPSTFGIAQFLFSRGLGLVYLIAILSWWVQADGLVGSNGIVPQANFLVAVKQTLGESAFWKVPTIFLWNSSDAFRQGTCSSGVILSILVVAGVFQGPCLALLWVIYLSLVSTGSVFMSFQWDSLLLETGFLAAIFAPWRLWTGPHRIFPDASRWIVFLLHFLLWKLMFFSGAVKIASDPAWRDGTALMHHYETQPLPHVIAWYTHQFPDWFQTGSSWIMLMIEIALPFCIFLGRRPRLAAFVGIAGLMVLIMATGNFAYFNLLTLVLCLPLLDDSLWPGFIKRRFEEKPETRKPKLEEPRFKFRVSNFEFKHGLRLVPGILVFALSIQVCQRQLIYETKWLKSPVLPGFLASISRAAQPFYLANGYGLFRVMTRERPEIIIEGSADGKTWIPYDFRWKPDFLDQRPKLVAPHQPRMDWQMWFAALGYRYQRSARTVWFENLMTRLLQGSPEVTALFAKNPFPDQPPRFVRAKLYRYHFTTFRERKETGNWWKCEDLGLFFPEISLRQ